MSSLADYIKQLQNAPRISAKEAYGDNYSQNYYNEKNTSADSLAALHLLSLLQQQKYPVNVNDDNFPDKTPNENGRYRLGSPNDIYISGLNDLINSPQSNAVNIRNNPSGFPSNLPNRWQTLNHELGHLVNFNNLPIEGIPNNPYQNQPEGNIPIISPLIKTMQVLMGQRTQQRGYDKDNNYVFDESPQYQTYAKQNPQEYGAKNQAEYNAEMFSNFWRNKYLSIANGFK